MRPGLQNAREFAKRLVLFPLQVEDAKLSQKYQKITGAMTVVFDGKEQTLQQLGRYMEEPDRALRLVAITLATAREM